MDTQRELRGHDFLPPPEVLSTIPPLYGTEHVPTDEKIIHVHYFTAGSDHYVAEIGQREEDGHWLGFGYAILAVMPDSAEWGYVDLTEAEAMLVHCRGVPLIVERDLHWTPKPFRLVMKERP